VHPLLRPLFVLALASSFTTTASAQDEEYAWGGGGNAEEGEAAPRRGLPEDPLRIAAFAGAGVGFRLLRNLDAPFSQDFVAPGYLDVGFAAYAPGGDVRIGGGLAISTTITQDQMEGVAAFEQWAFTPAVYLLVPIYRLMPDLGGDWLQIQAHLGLPIVVTAPALGVENGVNVTLGGELGLGLNIKFLAGIGVYVEAQVGVYGGSNDTVHPLIGIDGGFLIDYEVL
jgi:hypothetical protein